MPASEDLYLRCLLEQKGDHALIFLDEAGTIVSWRAGAQSVFGYEPEEAVGRHVSILFTPEDLANGVSRHELALARSCGRAEDDRWLVRKGNARFWATGSSIALSDGDGNHIGFAKIIRDRTEVRAQVETLENELRVAHRRSELKDNFIARLAHEIRNPLSTIKMTLQALAYSGAGASPKFVSTIEDQLHFMLRLVNDLQEGSRAGSNRIPVERRVTAIQDILAKAAEAAEPHALERRHQFKVMLVPAPLQVEVDPDRIRQAVTNLLENAIKYTPEGGRIWLKCTSEGHEAVIRVEDDGIGIDKDALPWIFDLFTRARDEAAPANRSLGAGLGLGLPLVKELVSLNGGTVQVRSEGRGRGAEFSIRLPLAGRHDPGGIPYEEPAMRGAPGVDPA